MIKTLDCRACKGRWCVARPQHERNDRTIAYCKEPVVANQQLFEAVVVKEQKWQDPYQTTVWFNNCNNHRNDQIVRDNKTGDPFRGLLTDHKGLQGVPDKDGDE